MPKRIGPFFSQRRKELELFCCTAAGGIVSPACPMLPLLAVPVSSWLYCPTIIRQCQPLCFSTNFSTSARVKRSGPPFVKRTHGNSPALTLRRTVITLTAKSFATSRIPTRAFIGSILLPVPKRTPFFGPCFRLCTSALSARLASPVLLVVPA